MPDAAARLTLAGLSLAGLWAAVTMTGAYYGWWRGPAALVPARLCSTKTGGCLDILATRFARAFGPPNSALGIVYYSGLLGVAVIGPGVLPTALLTTLQCLAWGVVGFSLYLAWSLLFRLRTGCPICFMSHAINLAIALLLALNTPAA
jgi:uncharacterized membrane protein